MPCNSDYMEPTREEVDLSQVLELLRELKTGEEPRDHHWQGYHPAAYTYCTKEKLDCATAELCRRLAALDPYKVKTFSLELQMWWRDHQRADAARRKHEAKNARKDALVISARQKLTPDEREALGL